MGAVKSQRLFQIGINSDGFDVFRQQLHIGIYFRILKAKDGKGGFILVPSVCACVFDLLERRGFLLAAELDIFQRQVSVLVQHFPEAPQHFLPCVSLDLEGYIARQVLPEIQQFLSVRCCRDDRVEAFMLRDRHIVGGRRRDRMGRDFGLAAVSRQHSGVHNLAVLVVRKADGAVAAPVPAFIRNDSCLGAVSISDFHLRQQLGFCSVLIPDAPCAAAAPIPAVRQLHGKIVIPCGQQIGHVIGLILNPFAVIGITRRKAEIARLPAADPGFA